MYVKLAERLIAVEPGAESYLHRAPFIDNLYFIDKEGNDLEFKTNTSPEMLQFHTQIGDFCLVFQNPATLVFGLPDHTTGGLRFRIRPTHWQKMDSGGSLKHIRNTAYRVNNGRVALNQTKVDDDNSLIVEFIVHSGQDTSIVLHIGDDKEPRPMPFSIVREETYTRWQKWFDHAPQVLEQYREKYAYAWWVMANNLVNPLGFIGYESMMPTKAFYVGIWSWDSALHAIAYRHMDPHMARNQVRAILAHQLPSGMLPDAIFDEGVISEIDHPIKGLVTKPPIHAWAALKIHETDPDMDFLKEIYEPLIRFNNWWFEHNDDDKDGIVQYTHPYSSGLDNSPLWDQGLPVESPDINTYLTIQMMCLAEIAKIIGKHEEASNWRKRASALTKLMVKELWDEKAGLFRALYNEKPIPVISPFNLYPLWTGQLPSRIVRQLLVHLKDPAELWGTFGLPTVAYNDPAYNSDKMWRGPVWANINYFFVEALQKVGEYELASELREKTLNLIASQPGIREYYNSTTGQAPASAAPTFGWTAAVFIDLALQATAESKLTGGIPN